MRDLLSKLDRILLEETTLQDLKKEPMAKDPVIAKAIKQKEREEDQEESTDKGRDTSWMRDPEDPESKIPAMFRKEKAADRSAAEKSIDDLNKKAGAKVWRTPREGFEIGDEFGISLSEDFEIGAEIVDILEDGIVIELDDRSINYLTRQGFTFEAGEIVEGKQHDNSKIYDRCWKGYKKVPGKARGEKGSCEKIGESGLQYYTGKKKYGKEGMAALAAAGRKGASEEELGRIKDRYKKEDIVSEAENYGSMPADAVRILYNVYKDESQGVRQHHDQEGAERIGKALNDTARELGVSKYMRSLYNSAAGSAHMDFDTDPGGFVNWFTYVGSNLAGLYKIHKEKGSYDDSPDVEVEKESINYTEAADSEGFHPIMIDGGKYFIKDGPEGPILQGNDVEGPFIYQDDGYLDFEANIKTGEYEIIRLRSGAYTDAVGGYHPSEKYDEGGEAVDDFIQDLISKVKKEYGSTWDEISDELKGVSVEKEDFENLIIEDRLSGFLNRLARFLVDLGFISTTITSNWGVESVLNAVIEEEDSATAAEAEKMLTQFKKFSKTKELGDDLADAMFHIHGDIDEDDPYFYSDINTRHRFNKRNIEPDVEIDRESIAFEAKYQGREVPLGKPMKGDVKKSKVYVKNAKGNVVKVNFGDKKMRIKKSNPKRRKSFRARHNCATAKDRTTARYWSCRSW